MSNLGCRDPHTFKKLPLVESLRLTVMALKVESLVREGRQADLMQFLHEATS